MISSLRVINVAGRIYFLNNRKTVTRIIMIERSSSSFFLFVNDTSFFQILF